MQRATLDFLTAMTKTKWWPSNPFNPLTAGSNYTSFYILLVH